MSLFKRVTLTLTTKLDQLVGEIENHDAVVAAGIRDSRRLYATAKVRHARLRQEGERLRRRLEGLRAEAATWQERARRFAQAAETEEQALLCLRRAKQAAAAAAAVAASYQQQCATEQRLAHEIAAMREQVAALEQRRQLLRSREATAQAASRLGDCTTVGTLDLAETFERWETRVTESELECDAAVDTDPFEAELLAAEERAMLQAELADLRDAAVLGQGVQP